MDSCVCVCVWARATETACACVCARACVLVRMRAHHTIISVTRSHHTHPPSSRPSVCFVRAAGRYCSTLAIRQYLRKYNQQLTKQ